MSRLVWNVGGFAFFVQNELENTTLVNINELGRGGVSSADSIPLLLHHWTCWLTSSANMQRST